MFYYFCFIELLNKNIIHFFLFLFNLILFYFILFYFFFSIGIRDKIYKEYINFCNFTFLC